jgi:hypothetical protein
MSIKINLYCQVIVFFKKKKESGGGDKFMYDIFDTL